MSNNCINFHNHKNTIKLENIDEEQTSKFFCLDCDNFGCEKCIDKNHYDCGYEHKEEKLDINKIIELKEVFLKKKIEDFNKRKESCEIFFDERKKKYSKILMKKK